MTEDELLRQIREESPAIADILDKMWADGSLATYRAPKNEPITVIAGLWSEVVEGSIEARCERCGSRISLAPKTQQMLEGRTAETHIVCMSCDLMEDRRG